MDLPSYFDDFLTEIRPSTTDQKAYKEGHEELRKNLNADVDLAKLLVNSFIQGSYRRKTAIAAEGKDKSDLDVVAVTRIPSTQSPRQVQKIFEPFLDKHYKGLWKPNDRSFKITLPKIEIDLVITAAPSEMNEALLKAEWITADEPPADRKDSRLVKSWIVNSSTTKFRTDGLVQLMEKAAAAQWQLEPLLIPDKMAGNWERTHPLKQIEWTWEKNADCNTHYINVVKALKWWKRLNPSLPKYPKGYPLEHIIGFCCPNGISSVGVGVTLTLEAIVSKFANDAMSYRKPVLPDHGVPEHDVLKRVERENFLKFYDIVKSAAVTARKALDHESKVESIRLWQQLFGSEKFPGPDPDDDDSGGGPSGPKGGYTPRTEPSNPGRGRFA